MRLIDLSSDKEPKYWEDAELAMALRLRSEGLTATAIADALSEAGFPARDAKRVSVKLRALEAV